MSDVEVIVLGVCVVAVLALMAWIFYLATKD